MARFGTLRPTGMRPVIRSDNGLIYQSRRFRAACRDYRLHQEFITPYTPEQNGIIERFFPEPERRVRLAALVPELSGSSPIDCCVDPMVQRGEPAPGAGLSEPT